MTTARTIIDAEVRELVRRRALDPIADRQTVAALVGDVVADYQDRAATSRLPHVGDADALSRSVLDAVAGFGPLQSLFDDPEVDDFRASEPAP